MTNPGTEPQEPEEFDGPDPREWRLNDSLWHYVEDIEAIDAMIALIKGPVGQEERGPARAEALEFLREAGYQRREELSRLLLAIHDVKIPDKPQSVFERAGKVRAYTPGERTAAGTDRSAGAPDPKT